MSGIPSLRKTGAGASLLAVLLVAACGPAPSASPTPTLTIAPQPTATEAEVATTPTGAVSLPTATTKPIAEATPTLGSGQMTPAPEDNIGSFPWQQVGLEGKRITDIGVMQGQTLDLVFVSAPYGAWLSKFGYTNWTEQKVTGAADDARLSDAEVASADVLYYTSHTGCPSGLPHVAWRSTDGGATWEKMDNDILNVTSANASTAYAAACSGVLKTTDSGATWTKLSIQQSSSDPMSIAASPDGQIVYAAFVSEGGTGQIWMSNDGGATWTDASPKNFPPGEGFVAPDNLIYVTGSVGRPDDGGLYLTNQQGVWHLAPESTTEWTLMKKPQIEGEIVGSYDWYTALLVDTNYSTQVDKQGPVIYTARAKASDHAEPLSLGVWRTLDMGATWQSVGKDMTDSPIHTLALALTDSSGTGRGLGAGVFETLLAGTDDGIWALQRK